MHIPTPDTQLALTWFGTIILSIYTQELFFSLLLEMENVQHFKDTAASSAAYLHVLYVCVCSDVITKGQPAVTDNHIPIPACMLFLSVPSLTFLPITTPAPLPFSSLCLLPLSRANTYRQFAFNTAPIMPARISNVTQISLLCLIKKRR